MAEPSDDEDLQVRHSRSRATWWVLLAAVLVAVGVWFATHPEPLATSDESVRASTPVGVPVYVGVFRLPDDEDRSLEISDVEVVGVRTDRVAIAPLVCRGGALGVTTAPSAFCDDLVSAPGSRLGPGDMLVLQLTGESPGSAGLERVRVSYRSGLQWATQEAGHPVQVEVVDR
jgi:hypothetical protein